MIYPKHLAIIPDGNRTRSKANNLSVFEGYLKSVDVAISLVEYIFTHTDIDVFTGRGMSTENLIKRPTEETNYLFQMYKMCGDKLEEIFDKLQVNFIWIGNPIGISADFLEYLNKMSNKYKLPNSPKTVIFAVNYGGIDEIVRGVQKMINHKLSHNQTMDDLTSDDISEHMDLYNIAPVDLIIRPKGETSKRLSGLMNRRNSYAEIYFTPKLYPEFDTKIIDEALVWFDQISSFRNFGK